MQKRKPLRLPKLLKAANGAPCMSCGAQDGTVVAAHGPKTELDGGMGLKPSDCYSAYLCHACHDYVDGRTKRYPGEETPKSVWRRAYYATVRYWFAQGVVK